MNFCKNEKIQNNRFEIFFEVKYYLYANNKLTKQRIIKEISADCIKVFFFNERVRVKRRVKYKVFNKKS